MVLACFPLHPGTTHSECNASSSVLAAVAISAEAAGCFGWRSRAKSVLKSCAAAAFG